MKTDAQLIKAYNKKPVWTKKMKSKKFLINLCLIAILLALACLSLPDSFLQACGLIVAFVASCVLILSLASFGFIRKNLAVCPDAIFIKIDAPEITEKDLVVLVSGHSYSALTKKNFGILGGKVLPPQQTYKEPGKVKIKLPIFKSIYTVECNIKFNLNIGLDRVAQDLVVFYAKKKGSLFIDQVINKWSAWFQGQCENANDSKKVRKRLIELSDYLEKSNSSPRLRSLRFFQIEVLRVSCGREGIWVKSKKGITVKAMPKAKSPLDLKLKKKIGDKGHEGLVME